MKLAEVFKMGNTETKKFVYTGFELDQTTEGIKVSQNEYAKTKVEVFDVKPDRAKSPDSELKAEPKKNMSPKPGGKKRILSTIKDILAWIEKNIN